jgi:ubiquinone biosynthesis monooxygenase Coq7
MDPLLISIDNALRTLFATPTASKTVSAGNNALSQTHVAEDADTAPSPLTREERELSGALMRVNHVGEVCAQALYAAQQMATSSPSLKALFQEASKDEFDHLAWTDTRISELQSHKSYLNPLWYLGAFGIGYLAGKVGGDKISLGFVVETERQVSAHLKSHLDKLPKGDDRSREIVKQMIIDEEGHAKTALSKGARELPPPVKSLMRFAAKVMTQTAHYI